jgi:hypothetical protein
MQLQFLKSRNAAPIVIDMLSRDSGMSLKVIFCDMQQALLYSCLRVLLDEKKQEPNAECVGIV